MTNQRNFRCYQSNRSLISVLVACLAAALDYSATAETQQSRSGPWAEWMERDFPFFSSVVDARHVGASFPNNNLTPRGLVLNLGQNCWACFDTDLLRVSAVWDGKAVT